MKSLITTSIFMKNDKKIILITILILIVAIIVFGVSYYLYKNRTVDDEIICEVDNDCPVNYSCRCAEIIPACPICAGGECIYKCLKKE